MVRKEAVNRTEAVIIKVRVSKYLRQYFPSSISNLANEEWDLPEGTTVGEVLKMLRLSNLYANAILVNGHLPKRETILKKGDEIYLFPPLGGG